MKDMDKFLDGLSTTSRISVGITTDGLHGPITGVAFATFAPVPEGEAQRIRVLTVEGDDVDIGAHFSKFQGYRLVTFNTHYVSRALSRHGVSVLFDYDPMLHCLALGNQKYNYKKMLETYAGVIDESDPCLAEPEQAPISAKNILWLSAILEAHHEVPMDFLCREAEVASVLGVVTEHGFPVNVASIKSLKRAIEAQLSSKLRDLEGIADAHGVTKFSVTSAAKVSKLLFDRLGVTPVEHTEKGNPSTSISALRAANHPTALAIVDARREKSTLKVFTSLEKGSVSPDWRVMGPRGVVPSSSSPPLGDIPPTAYRAFTTYDGLDWVCCSYNTLALEYLAHLMGCDKLIEDLDDGVPLKDLQDLLQTPFSLLEKAAFYASEVVESIPPDFQKASLEIERAYPDFVKSLAKRSPKVKGTNLTGIDFTIGRIILTWEPDPKHLWMLAAKYFRAHYVKWAMLDTYRTLVAMNVPVRCFAPFRDCFCFQMPDSWDLYDLMELLEDGLSKELEIGDYIFTPEASISSGKTLYEVLL